MATYSTGGVSVCATTFDQSDKYFFFKSANQLHGTRISREIQMVRTSGILAALHVRVNAFYQLRFRRKFQDF